MDRVTHQVVDERTSALLSSARVPILVVADIAHPGGETLAPVVEILHRPVTMGSIADAVDRLIAHRQERGATGS